MKCDYKRSILFVSFLILTSFSFLITSCKSEQPDQQTGQDGIVATVGSFEISDDHFRNELLRFYYRTGQAVNINPELRRTVVDSRVNRYTVVEFAREKGWQHEPEAQYELAQIERKVNMEEFERRFIHNDVSVTDSDLRTLFNRLNTTLKASHLFMRNRVEADSVYQLLQNGANIEELARNLFQNPALAQNGGDIGYFTVDDMDIAFEDRAYQMKVGEVSKPVKTSRGYSIIKVTDRVSTPVVTESEYANSRNDIYPLALDQKKELATRRHMELIIDSFEFNEETVRELWQAVNENYFNFTEESPAAETLIPSLQQEDYEKKIIDQADFTLTVGEFLHEAYLTPAERRSEVRELNRFRELLEGIAYRSYALGLVESHPEYNEHLVQRTIEETFYNYLLERFDRHLDGLVTVAEQQVTEEFNENRELYMDPMELNLAEIIVTNEQDAESAWQKLMDGRDFVDVLQEYTIDREALRFEGELGFIPIDRFGTMSTSLGSMQPGEYAGPFQISSHRFVIFKCLDRKEARDVTFEEAQPRVREYLHSQVKEQIREDIINDAREKYDAQIFTERLNSLPIEL